MTPFTAKYLRTILRYEPNTGNWYWLVDRSAQRKAGSKAGCLMKSGYRVIGINRRSYASARLAVLYMKGHWPKNSVDHRDRNPGNDRWKNLREADFFIQNNNRKNCRDAR